MKIFKRKFLISISSIVITLVLICSKESFCDNSVKNRFKSFLAGSLKKKSDNDIIGVSKNATGKKKPDEILSDVNKNSSLEGVVGKHSHSFVKAAKIATKAVVHIKSVQESKVVSKKREEMPWDKFIEKFFGEKLPEIERYRSKSRVGFGSGVILSSEGYIITNNHLVEGSDSLEVTLHDNSKYKAKVIGQDVSTDLSVIKIDKTGLPFLEIGDSNAIEVGEWVLAVGNPLGLNSTVTAGIVSAKGRSRSRLSSKKLEIGSFIQTDAAINMGNSGGALVNLSGQLVGINTAIMAPTGVFAGYGFAIPSKIVKKVWLDMVKFGTVQKGLLNIVGINVLEAKEMVTQKKSPKEINLKELKNTLNSYKKLDGVLVVKAIKNKAAYNAGIKPYDIIIKINNIAIKSMSHLQEILIGEYKPGDIVFITYLRKGTRKTTRIVLETNNKYRVIKIAKGLTTNSIEGAIFENISPQLLKKYKISKKVKGVRIKYLKKGKWQVAGVNKDFVVTSIVHLDASKKHVDIVDLKILCEELNSLSDNRIVVEGFYLDKKNHKKGYVLYW